MQTILPYVEGFAAGAAAVGLWWFWINHRAQVRAAEQAALNAAKKL